MTFKKPQVKTTPKKIAVIAGGLFILSLVIAVGVYLIDTTTNQATKQEGPAFTTVTPNGASIDQYGGWQRVSPPETDPVFVYSDEINGVAISVSQQPLPAQFQGDIAGRLSQIAQDFNATDKISSEPDTYIGKSAQGPQSVITSKSGLLILITSKTSVENDAWISYINSLR